jgi:hypothetical protein
MCNAMKHAFGILVFSLLGACSDDAVVASSSAPLDQVTLGDAVKARGCAFTIGTGTQPQTFPPIYVAFVRVTGNPHQCTHEDITLGTSYALPSVAIAVGHGDVVADWSSKSTPSGEAHTQLFIAEISPQSETIVKETELAAMSPDINHPQQGNVYDGALDVRGNALVVTGGKDGIIPGEIGSGDHYIATYARFFDTADTTPTVFAY